MNRVKEALIGASVKTCSILGRFMQFLESCADDDDVSANEEDKDR